MIHQVSSFNELLALKRETVTVAVEQPVDHD